jgi:branched-chain amino acid transport system permease protein
MPHALPTTNPKSKIQNPKSTCIPDFVKTYRIEGIMEDGSLALQYLLSGVTKGSIYAVVAIGFNLIYSATGVLNFAQGEFVMLGGMIAVTLAAFLPLPVAIACAVIMVALIGCALEILFFRRLRRHSILHMIIITIGLSIVIQEIALHVWDEKMHFLPYFTGNEISSIHIFGAAISPQVLWVLGTGAVSVVSLYVFLKYTLQGRAMRACSSNPEAAVLVGINISNMRTLAFGLSAALGALAGCVISPITMTHYEMGAPLAIKGFAAAILGGFGNPMAAVLGGLLVGILEAFSVSRLPSAYSDVSAFAVLLLVLFVRPHGLFGTPTAESLREF